ncbi:serine hydrolase [Sphingomonas trueperi]|uniref:serine hydrolase n=1 Tax=Sphingomonas trueperi TaxID=53317 RepID=UPI000EABA220
MRLIAIVPPLLACGTPCLAQTAPAAPAAAPVQAAKEFRDRVNQLPDLLQGKGDYDAAFSDAFRAQVPKATFDTVRQQIAASAGPYSDLQHLDAKTPWSGTITVEYRDALVSMAISVDPAGDHRITGLLVQGVTAREATLDAVEAALKGLPGRTGYALAKLGDGKPQLLRQHNADQAFAIGSEFKLVILAELIRATSAGERSWDDMVTLDGSELPGGGYTAKPAGTKVSLRELATQMISISDNSATDILLKTLGRTKVEAMLPVVGIADPARNRPFLGTGEVFKLKTIPALRDRYIAANEAERRALLAGEVAATPLSKVDVGLFSAGKPLSIDTLEWFETPADLVRVMDWIRRNTEGPKGKDARAVLSKNPGIPPLAASKWSYVGYKGGSEPGVIAMTLLLQGKDGGWTVLSASWNDPAQEVEQGRFAGLVGKAAELAAPPQ